MAVVVDFRFPNSKVWHLVVVPGGGGVDFRFRNSKVWHVVVVHGGGGDRFQISKF